MRADPVAILGVGARYPGAVGEAALWEALRAPQRREVGQKLDDQLDTAAFGVPPVQFRATARVQFLVLDVVGQAMTHAGLGRGDFDPSRVDVICGTCFGFERTYANALRVLATGAVDDWLALREAEGAPPADPAALRQALRRAVRKRFGASPYDRVGEMASSIPARVSIAFGLHGRALAVESADATSFAALDVAIRNLRSGACDLAIVATAQRLESQVISTLLASKRLLAPGPSLPLQAGGAGFSLGEGVGALVLCRAGDAGDRALALITGVGRGQEPRRGGLRYPTAAGLRGEVWSRAWVEAGLSGSALAYAECFGSGFEAETRSELQTLTALADGAPVRVGCAKDVFGHTFANSGLLAVSKVALAMRAGLLPGALGEDGDGALVEAPLSWSRAPSPWPEDRPAAVVSGSGLSGCCFHLVMEKPSTKKIFQREAGPAARSAEEIAIVSYGGVFAEAEDAARFWQNAAAARAVLGEVPEAVLPRHSYLRPQGMDPLASYTATGSHVPPLARPPGGLKIPLPRWQALDPAARLSLQVAVEAMSRHTGAPLSGRGLVVMGSSLCLGSERALYNRGAVGEISQLLREEGGYQGLSAEATDRLLAALEASVDGLPGARGPWAIDGAIASSVASLVANELLLDAVPVCVEAACASSLAAIDMAVRGLRARDFDFALAGGVELPCNARDFVLCASLGLLSRDRITPFSDNADGFSIGDGAAVFLLKRLDDAKRDGDRVIAVIRGVGASCDARSLVAPDAEGQALAVRRAFDEVPYPPSSVAYVETHGTGTTLGDQIEVLSIALNYCDERRASPLVLGSVKSLIGHTFAAAGSAGLLKAVLALEHQTLPPNGNLDSLNPSLSLDQLPATVLLEARPWAQAEGAPRRAGVSAFGTGGINYHVLIEEPGSSS